MKNLLSEYKKSRKSGWVYQPKLTGVRCEDLKIGDVVCDMPLINDESCIFKVEGVDNVRGNLILREIEGFIGYYMREADGSCPFALDDEFWCILP